MSQGMESGIDKVLEITVQVDNSHEMFITAEHGYSLESRLRPLYSLQICPPAPLPPTLHAGGCWGDGGAERTAAIVKQWYDKAEGEMGNICSLNRLPN